MLNIVQWNVEYREELLSKIVTTVRIICGYCFRITWNRYHHLKKWLSPIARTMACAQYALWIIYNSHIVIVHYSCGHVEHETCCFDHHLYEKVSFIYEEHDDMLVFKRVEGFFVDFYWTSHRNFILFNDDWSVKRLLQQLVRNIPDGWYSEQLSNRVVWCFQSLILYTNLYFSISVDW